VSYSLTFVM